MAPEILIVGDPAQRDDLVRSVRSCQYEANLCPPRELHRRVRMGAPPAAIVICIEDADPALLLAGLRRSRVGAAIPVILHGALGGEIRELADVIDLGADQFLGEPIDPARLAEALAELAGPPSGRTETGIVLVAEGPRLVKRNEESDDAAVGSAPRERGTSAFAGPRPPRGVEIGAGGTASPEPRPDAQVGSDPSVRPVLGSLHQTLDRLEARLRERDRRDRPSEGDGIDLEALGLDGIPDVDRGLDPGDPIEAADSGIRRRLIGAGVDESVGATASTDAAIAPTPGLRPRAEGTELLTGGSGTFPRSGEGPGEGGAALRGRRPERPADDAGPSRERGGAAERPSAGSSSSVRAPASSTRSLAEAGKLEPGEVLRLLWRLHEGEFTGSVTLQRDRVEKQLWFERGALAFVRSNDSADRFVDGLLRRGILTRPQYETARRLAAKEPRRIGRMLVEAGFLKAGELAVLLRDHLARVMDGTFTWDDASYRIDVGDRCEESIRLDVPMPALILEGVRYRFDTAELRRVLWRDAGGELVCPRLVDGEGDRPTRAAELTATFRLLPEEEAWLTSFDGRHPIAALLEMHDDEAGLLAVVHAMHVCGCVTLETAAGAARDRAGEVDEGWTPAREGDPVEIDGQRIADRLRLARDGDYFELLGLARDASRAEIRRAHRELVTTFADDRIEEQTAKRFESELMDLRGALDEAKDILLDDAMRGAYLAHLGDP